MKNTIKFVLGLVVAGLAGAAIGWITFSAVQNQITALLISVPLSAAIGAWNMYHVMK